MRPDTPAVERIITTHQIAQTADSIVAMQEASGAIPWTTGEHTDLWNHVEGAMALLVAGRVAEAEKAYDWALTQQRHDGSMPLKIVDGVLEDASGETNMTAYLAVGVWHHWLIRHDEAFVRRMWPAVRAGLDWVVSMQQPWGGIRWSQEWTSVEVDGQPAKRNEECLLAGSSSIYQSLRAAVAIAELLGEPQPEWELAGGRLGHALREHRDRFLDKSEFSMDWYYPVLGGAVRGQAAQRLLESRWDEFVMPGLGARCILPNAWVTGAETCELVMSLDAIGDRERALQLFADMQHLRHENGSYWTGSVHPEGVNWPVEQTTYTAAAMILAADALSLSTPGATIMRGTTLAPDFGELGLACGCERADVR
ncbi:MAG: prenyltransferase [Nocardioides sp.]